MEKDKRMEAQQINHTSELEALEHRKDLEIAALQEQITTTYKDMTGEIETLQQKLIEVSNEQDYQTKCANQKLVGSEEQHKLLTEHIQKL